MLRLTRIRRDVPGPDLNSLAARVDSCAPAHFDLSVLPIYVARGPAAPFTRSYPRHFTFYVADPISSIASRPHRKHLSRNDSRVWSGVGYSRSVAA
jgi:hypothetical protein